MDIVPLESIDVISDFMDDSSAVERVLIDS
jgi:hypothetical protein